MGIDMALTYERRKGMAIDFCKNLGIEPEELLDTSSQETQNQSDWITRKEAAGYAKVSPDTIDNWRKAGKIKFIKLADGRPGAVRISRRSLERFLAGKVKIDPDKRVRNNPRKGERYRVN